MILNQWQLVDLQDNNLVLDLDPADHNAFFAQIEALELTEPSPRKIDGDRVIYKTRIMPHDLPAGRVILTDFSEAMRISGPHTKLDGKIQPFEYRCPEVLFGIPWGIEADI